MKKIKEKKLFYLTLGISSVLLILMAITTFLAQNQVEAHLTKEKAVTKKTTSLDSSEGIDQNSMFPKKEELYKDNPFIEEKVKQKVCEKFNLDIEKITNDEITEEMTDYEIVTTLLLVNGDEDVLNKGATNGVIQSLETYIGDIFAFSSAREVIEEMCKAAKIDPNMAKIKDLDEELLLAICKISDH